MSEADAIDPDLLQRLRTNDAAARGELCELYLPELMAARPWGVSGVRDDHLIEEAAYRALMDFMRAPHRYDPQRLPIRPYLRMIARRRLQNLLAREQRHAIHRASLDDVELSSPVGNDSQEAPDLPSGISHDLLQRRLREDLPDERDRHAAQMITDNVRETAAYARLYGLTDLPGAEQFREVKRHKDRLKARMKRLGKRLRDG